MYSNFLQHFFFLYPDPKINTKFKDSVISISVYNLFVNTIYHLIVLNYKTYLCNTILIVFKVDDTKLNELILN